MTDAFKWLCDHHYGRRIAYRLRRRARHPLGVHNPELIHSAAIPCRETLLDLLDQGADAGRITIDEALYAGWADIVIAGDDGNGAAIYVVCEAAIVIERHDADRARERSDIIARAAGAAVVPVVAGTEVTAEARQRAAALGVTVIILPEDPG